MRQRARWRPARGRGGGGEEYRLGVAPIAEGNNILGQVPPAPPAPRPRTVPPAPHAPRPMPHARAPRTAPRVPPDLPSILAAPSPHPRRTLAAPPTAPALLTVKVLFEEYYVACTSWATTASTPARPPPPPPSRRLRLAPSSAASAASAASASSAAAVPPRVGFAPLAGCDTAAAELQHAASRLATPGG